MNNIIFRVPGENDALQVAVLLAENYNFSSAGDARDFFTRSLKEGMQYLVAETSGSICGLLAWNLHDIPKHCLAELHKIAVSNAFKGSGLAQELFAQGCRNMHDFYRENGFFLRKLYVMAHETNPRAIRFYEKLGFRTEAVLPNHYYDGVNEVVLAVYFEKSGGKTNAGN